MCRSGGKDHVPDPKISSPSRFAVLDVEEGQVDMGEGIMIAMLSRRIRRRVNSGLRKELIL